MPGMDGLETARRAACGIVVFTVSDRLEEKIAGFRLGVLDYITKPVAPDELVARVMAHLGHQLELEGLQARLDAYQRRFGLEVDAAPAEVAAVLMPALARIEPADAKPGAVWIVLRVMAVGVALDTALDDLRPDVAALGQQGAVTLEARTAPGRRQPVLGADDLVARRR